MRSDGPLYGKLTGDRAGRRRDGVRFTQLYDELLGDAVLRLLLQRLFDLLLDVLFQGIERLERSAVVLAEILGRLQVGEAQLVDAFQAAAQVNAALLEFLEEVQ